MHFNYFSSLFQIEFDKTAEAFRRTHGERDELIRQWEQTITLMKKRDDDIDNLATVRYLLLNMVSYYFSHLGFSQD